MTDYSEIKAKLVAKRKELELQLEGTQATERHEVEEGLNDNAQLWEVSEIRDGLDDVSAADLNQINQALARIDAGDYGVCQSCGNAIGEARLEALPYVTLCSDCAEGAEELDKESLDPNEY
jgi:RNA polymerase-binding transcription factor DksA